MHIYIGGAHNGKRAYVRKVLKNQRVQWFEGELPDEVNSNQHFVVAGLENWLLHTDLPEQQAIDLIVSSVKGQNAVIILTDMNRGIVPMEAAQRNLRDVCGRLYQRLILEADEVTRIWYGLAQNLKKRGD
ncbi:bifunctional adenosylcobinamide kinase/adenosylcobinamide-phosphate guanylyltransferase [Sporosarcina siberiensis]|uniref:Bifunctional adenosylcobinamide kinase/adenosylcobinamide-phosphate guanylyltransferase n=1 Tax=Sporosarcina siberiensis TaxID=1365606 RepID=A0ABW4SIR2_9BACL